jgi:hypothetical protein
MAWPTPQDYQEAMQNPRLALSDNELQLADVAKDSLGLPRPISGGFASVYKLICAQRTWAVRCFLKEFKDQNQRYSEISKQLASSKFEFATHFEFVEKGIRVHSQWFPIVKMEWIQGESLSRFVELNLNQPQKIVSLGQDIVEIGRMLNQAGMAHGDLQHGNVIVSNGKPKLIDYDGMFVPAFKGWRTHEAGHPNYQLQRNDSDFGPGLDNFSVWVIYLSLRAISIFPNLWNEFKGGDECLILRRADFENPSQSRVLQKLKNSQNDELKNITTSFLSLLSLPPLKIPMINPMSPIVTSSVFLHGADWIRDHVDLKNSQNLVSNSSLHAILAKINQISLPSDNFPNSIKSVVIKPNLWQLSTNIPLDPVKPSILTSPPPLPIFQPPPAKFKKQVIPMDSSHKIIAAIAHIFLVPAPLLIGLGVVTGATGAGIFTVVFFITSGLFLLTVAISYATWWGVLEIKRRKEEADINQDFEQERVDHMKLEREHIDFHTRSLDEKKKKEKEIYDILVEKYKVDIIPHQKEAVKRRDNSVDTGKRYKDAEKKWKEECDLVRKSYDAVKSELRLLKIEIDSLEQKYESDYKDLLQAERERQRVAHLKQHLIENAVIDGIGAKRKQRLKENNVVTAYDVTKKRIMRISGFNEGLANNIISWRRDQIETSFIFRTANAIQSNEMKDLQSKYQILRNSIQQKLIEAEQKLLKISQEAANLLNNLSMEVQIIIQNHEQAKADVTVIPTGL